MKPLTLLLGALLVLGVATAAVAQSPSQPNTSPPASSSPAPSPKADVDVKADVKSHPSAPAKNPDINVNVDKRDRSDGDGSAFPRAAGGERTTILGLSPTAAVVIAAALSLALVSGAVGIVSNQLSRRVEQRADSFSLRLTEAPRPFIAFERGITVRNVVEPDPPGWVVTLLATHPPTVERIGAAVAYER
jgi:hypothetical protein